MESPSQSLAQASQLKKNRKRAKKSGRMSNVSHDDKTAVAVSPSTPLNRFAAHRSMDAFSPFSFRSSQGSPKPILSSSPSIILFSGPDQRRFERVHGDSFPQDVEVLKSIARSKFKLAPAAPVEMSFVNPDGVVCVLDDRDDLEALAAHAAVSQKLTVNVTSLATPAPHPPPAPTQQPQPFAHDVGLKEPSSSKEATGKRKRANNSPALAPSATLGSPVATEAPSLPNTPTAKKLKRGHPTESAGSATSPHVGAIPADASSAELYVPTAAAAEPLAPGQASDEAGPSQTPDASKAVSSQTTLNGVIERQQYPSETPKRGRVGRPKKVAAAQAQPSVAPFAPDSTAQATTSQQGNLAPAAAGPLVSTLPAIPSAIAQTEATSQTEQLPKDLSQAAKTNGATATGKPRGRPPKKAVASPDVATGNAVPSAEGSAPAPRETAPELSTAVSEAAVHGAKKSVRANRMKASEKAVTVANGPSQAVEEPASAARSATDSQEVPVVGQTGLALTASQTQTRLDEAAAPPAEKGARPTKADKVLKEASTVLANGQAQSVPPTSAAKKGARATKTVNGTKGVGAALTAEQTTATEPATDSPATSNTAVVAEPPSSALSSSESLQGDGPIATSNAPASNGVTATAKPRASKAAEKKVGDPVSNTCVVCGAVPDHEKEVCPVWQGGSQAILDLLAMIRHKGSKSKKEKETSKILYHWLAEQFGAGQGDAAPPSQDSTKASQEIVVPAPLQPTAETQGLSIHPSSTAREEAQSMPHGQSETGPAVAAASNGVASGTKAAQPTAAPQNRHAANESIAVDAESQAQLPPPSGVEAVADATQATAPVPLKKPRVSSTTATAAATAKSISSPSKPRIAMLPSSLSHSSTSLPNDAASRLRAPSESSEAELATSPMLSAAPRHHDDMDVVPLPSQSELVASNSAAQQLEERKHRMKTADKAARASSSSKTSKRGLVSDSTKSRSRSASITSSDTSNNGNSSDSDLGSDTDNDTGTAATKGGEATTKTTSAKAAPGAAQSAATRSQRGVKGAGNKATGRPDSGTDSLPSDSDPQTDSDSGSGSEPGPQPSPRKAGLLSSSRVGSSVGSATGTTRTTRRAPENPFLRGLNTLRTAQNGGGNTSQKSAPFTRLSELKPATLRQTLSQPGSPSSTGGSTPLSASGQTSFFPDSSSAPNGSNMPEQGEPDDESDSDSDSSTDSSDDEALNKRRGTGKRAVPTSKRAGAGAPTAPATKKRKGVFSFFT